MMTLNGIFLNEAELMFARHIGLPLGNDGLKLETESAERMFVKVEAERAVIGYSRRCEIYRGLALLKEELNIGDCIYQSRVFDSLAAFCDCSRNAVLKLDTIKSVIMDIAALGYDTLYLYTEDTFEIEGEEYFGHWRGRYSAEEIREADAFAKKFGIELVPAIQTLAHYNAVFHWKRYEQIHDIADILLCDAEETYEFLDKVFSTLRGMYTTDKINIGMDEAHLLGLGNYSEKFGSAEKMDIFLRHIGRVVKIAEKYGFKPIMWSDMFFKIATGKCTYEQLEAVSFNEKVLELIPQNITLTYWNYSPRPKEYYDVMFEAHKAMNREIIFAGGFRKWVGFCPNTHFSFEASRTALQSAIDHNVKKVMLTAWGDDGAEGAFYTALPGLALYAEKCYCNDMSDSAVNHRLNTLFGYSLEEFYLLEAPNRLPGNAADENVWHSNDAKTVLWNDPMLGQYDKHIVSGTEEYLSALADKLKTLSERDNRFAYIFETVYRLCEVLSIKAELGNKLRAAYKAGDRAELSRLCGQIPKITDALNTLHKTFRKNWLKENKIFGFDVQDIRFGALKARLEYTAEALSDYLAGNISSLAELEEEPLYIDCRDEESAAPLHSAHNNWKHIATVSVL